METREEEEKVQKVGEEEEESDEYTTMKMNICLLKKLKLQIKQPKKTETKKRGKTAAKAQNLPLAQIGSQLNAHQLNSPVNTVGNAFVQRCLFAAYSSSNVS